jgi:hypothetical protein
MYTELRRKRDALKDLCEDNIKIEEIAWKE